MRRFDYGNPLEPVTVNGRVYLRDHNPGAYAVRVPCLTCGKMVQLSEALIDPSGPSFRAYYHDACAQVRS